VRTSADEELFAHHVRVVREVGARTPGTYLGETTDGETPGSKVIFETYSQDVSEVAKRLCGLRHPHLVTVVSVEAIRSVWSIMTEYVDGLPLEDVFYRLSLGGRLRAVVDVLTALSALHVVDGGGAIVHRGILLRSAFIEKSGRTKLGFAYRNVLCAGPSASSYAPEVLLGDEAIDVRTDVYGAGVLLWEALTGRPLFGDAPAKAIIETQLAGRVDKALPAPADRWARSVLPVVERALAVDPKARYASIAEMAAALRIAVRARLMFHDDIIEEVWPAETVPKLASGIQPVAEAVSEMKVTARSVPELAPLEASDTTSGMLPVTFPVAEAPAPLARPPSPRRTPNRALVAVAVAFVLVVLVVAVAVTLSGVMRHAPAPTPPSTAQKVVAEPVAPTVTTQELDRASKPASGFDQPPTPTTIPTTTPHKAKRAPRVSGTYDPSSI
jgi:hypothetical protein